MAISLIEILLALLLVSAVLGIVGTLRRARTSAAGKADVLAYYFSAAIIACAVGGVWQYVQQRRSIAEQTTRMRQEFERFVRPPRPVRVQSNDSLQVELAMHVPCDALSEAARAEICGNGGALPKGQLPFGTDDELRERFVSGLEVGLWPAQRLRRDDDAPLLRYRIGKEDAGAVRLTTQPTPDSILFTVPRATARPAHGGQAPPPFMDIESAEVRVALTSSACDDGRCQVLAISILVDQHRFCAEGLRRRPTDYRGRLRPCGGG